jgi:GH15 family glucan-1,4-alpha-glucosidase
MTSKQAENTQGTPSSRPTEVTDYDIEHLSGDLTALLDHHGYEDATVIGHDWGAFVVWGLTLLHPDRVNRVVALSLPYPERGEQPWVELMEATLGSDFYFVHFNRQPGVADAVLEQHAFQFLRNLFRKNEPPGEPQPGMARGEHAWSPTWLAGWPAWPEAAHSARRQARRAKLVAMTTERPRRRIEDYGLLGDCRSSALVSRAGSIDWLCVPRFDSPACFAALVGGRDNGFWSLAPSVDHESERSYVPDTMVLTTTHRAATGAVEVTDALIPVDSTHRLVRVVRGRAGTVRMRMELCIRFDYGSIIPWVRRDGEAIRAIAGPDALVLRSPVEVHGADLSTVADFEITDGDVTWFDLAWHPSHQPPPDPMDVPAALDKTVRWWQRWAERLHYDGRYRDEVRSSLLVLKALTYEPTGAIVAAPTTSLPEWIGGSRNWDYRYCWLRDATFTLLAMLEAGCTDEAERWRDWLIRAIAGDPGQLQIMYGVAGERRLPEIELDWLDGFEGSQPVRVGNGAYDQLQIDIVGEVMDVLHNARAGGLEPDPVAWDIQKHMLSWLEENWRQPDEGIWEVRGERAHFTYSKVMAWVAFDRGVEAVETHHLDGPATRWATIRDQIHAEVCDRAVDESGAFTQSYGSRARDASTLIIPLVGFLPPDDPRVVATIEAIQRDLTIDGLVQRYRIDDSEDGVDGEEGTFLLCSFWLVDALAILGRHDEATQLYERLLTLRNDVGLLAEEYDPRSNRQLGNFPQAFSHVGLAGSAITLCPSHTGPSQRRSERSPR